MNKFTLTNGFKNEAMPTSQVKPYLVFSFKYTIYRANVDFLGYLMKEA